MKTIYHTIHQAGVTMRSILQITRFKTGYLCLTALLTAVLMFCNQVYDNPVSSKYDGDYKCSINWNGLDTDTIEILKPYSITIKDSGKDKYYQFEVITEPPILFKSEKDQENNTRLVFLEPFSGKLSVVATRPNLKKDFYDIAFSVINPYIISGDTVVGKNVPAKLRISRKDSKKIDSSLTVVWAISSVSCDTSSAIDQFSLKHENKDTVEVNATISNENGNYKLTPYIVRFEGEAPVIESAFLRDSLRLGEAPVIDVDFSDDDTGTIFFTVYSTAHNQLLTSSPQSASGNRITIICDIPVSDTIVTSLSIVATDQNGLVSLPKIITDQKILYTIPEVEFMSTSDTVYFPQGDKPYFIASGEADSFLWVVDDSAMIKGTKENTIELSPIMDTLWHKICVTGINYSFIKGNTDTLIYKARNSKYTLEEVTPFPSEIRIRKWYSWEVRTIDELKRVVGSDSVRYVWTYPDNFKDSLNEDSSVLYLFFEDSVKSFSIEVKAFVGNDSTTMDSTLSLIRNVKTRVYQPECHFELEKDSTLKLNDSIALKVIVRSPDPGDARIETVFYRVVLPDTTIDESRSADELWGYRFRDKGIHYLFTWATDSYGVSSDICTLKIEVITDKPTFNPAILRKTVYAKDTVRLTAFLDPHPHEIISYFWYLDSDAVIDTETVNNFIEKVFEDTGTFTIKVNCVNVQDDYAVKPQEILVTVLSNNPVIKEVINPEIVYINDACTSRVIAEDVGKHKGIKQYLYSPDGENYTAMSDSMLILSYNVPGWKRMYFKAVDSLNLPSQCYIDSVLVKSAIPVIDSVSVQYLEDSLYVNDNFNLVVYASDTNGTINGVYVSWDGDNKAEISDTLDSPVKVCTLSYSHSFDTIAAGERTIRVWAVDDDGQSSQIYTKKVYVSKGVPVINGFSPAQVWVRDLNTLALNATDVNGEIIKRWVDWNADGVWDDSSTVITYLFAFFWDTTFGDKFVTINTKAMDNDSIITSKTCSIFVKMGRPVISGANFGDSIQWKPGATDADLDTMFYIAKSEDTPIMVDTADSNGRIVEFYWDLDANGTINAGPTASPKWIAHNLIPNYPRKISVWGKDDDSIKSIPLTFVVFPDEPPPEPEIYSRDLDSLRVGLFWRYEDAKDKQNTQYAILLGKSSEDCKDTLVNFTRGTSTLFEKENEYYKYTVKPIDEGYNTTFYFMVIAKDERNSTSKSFGGKGLTVPYSGTSEK
jgi:hypothetical protein